MRERASDVVVERVAAMRLEALEVLVERIDEHPEGQVALELRCGAREHELAARARRVARSSARSGVLPMPGSPTSSSAAGLPLVELGEDAIELAELLGAPDEVLGKHGHSVRHHDRSGTPRNREIRVLPRCRREPSRVRLARVPRYMLHHRHEPHECGVVFASFKGSRKPAAPPGDARLVPLRGARDLVDRRGRIRDGGARAAPFYVAERTTAESVSEVEIP